VKLADGQIEREIRPNGEDARDVWEAGPTPPVAVGLRQAVGANADTSAR
jgi:hypothetical protein